MAFVFLERGDLDVQGSRHIYPQIRLVRPRHPDLFGRMWIQALAEQLGKIHPVAGRRKDGIERRRAGRSMIGVVDIGIHPKVRRRVAGYDDVGLEATDLAHNVAPHLGRVDQLTVVIVQEHHILYAKDGRRRALLCLPVGAQHLGRDVGAVAALVAAREQDVADFLALSRPLGQGPAAGKFRIVGVRHHQQNSPSFSVHCFVSIAKGVITRAIFCPDS